jgi:hypothetical protein
LLGNPAAVLPKSLWDKAVYWNKQQYMLCDVQQPAGLLEGIEPMAKAKAKAKAQSASSSSTTSAAPVAKKRPAAQK